jgi:HD-GYP domain-containing protein (c-di-GMP phosphodiesterase class II)
VTDQATTIPGLEQSQTKTAENFLRHLSAAARNRLFYPSDHSILKRSFASLRETAASLLEGRNEITVGLLGEDWIVQDLVLHKASALALDLKERLRDRGLTSFTLTKGFTDGDLEALVSLLTAAPEEVEDNGASSYLRGHGGSAVAVGRIALAKGEDPAPDASPEIAVPDTVPDELLRMEADQIFQLYAEAGEGAVDLNKARVIVSDVMDLVSSGSTELSTMLGIKSHDDYTFTHIVNVCVLTLGQTRGMNLPEEILNEIGLAALMHDVGKQRIPGEIIRKPARLTAEEFEIMKQHTVYGAEMLRGMSGASDLAIMVAFEHHLRYDCTGYPTIKRRRKLNFCTHMATIADAFDAMRTLRPYSEQMSVEEIAVRMYADSGTHFEPTLLKRFFRMLDLFPSGSRVSLSSGEQAVVVERRSSDYMRPLVKVTKDAEGRTLDDGPTKDLADPSCTSFTKICGTPEPVEAGRSNEDKDSNENRS